MALVVQAGLSEGFIPSGGFAAAVDVDVTNGRNHEENNAVSTEFRSPAVCKRDDKATTIISRIPYGVSHIIKNVWVFPSAMLCRNVSVTANSWQIAPYGGAETRRKLMTVERGISLPDTDTNDRPTDRDGGFSRRRLLKQMAVGAGAVTVTATPVGSSLLGSPGVKASETVVVGTPQPTGTFGRMFPHAPPFATGGPALTEALIDLGAPGGLFDAGDDLSASPADLITDPALSRNNPDNPTQTAGTTFLGQFIDHDLTFDQVSPLGVPTEPTRSPNRRNPSFDLDSVYGGGPGVSPQLYERHDRATLRIGHGGLFEDLPRDEWGTAIIGDPRNDENLMISGLHAALIKIHNRVVHGVRSRHGGDMSANEVFQRARRIVILHYQWIVLHEFLPSVVGRPMVDDVLREQRHFTSDVPFIPVEFQIAYRMGHSMIRPSYRANLAGDGGKPFFGMIFDPAGADQDDPVDLRGGNRAPRRFIGWQTFFDFGDGEIKRNKALDTKLSTPLFTLPLQTISSGEPPISLATRNLLRHVTWSIPSGQTLARKMGAPVVGGADLAHLSRYGIGLEDHTPLFLYVLSEAELIEGGHRLGPVGGRIVAEVFVGLLKLDADSILTRFHRFRPFLPRRTGPTGDFTMVDLLTVAGVDPESRGQ